MYTKNDISGKFGNKETLLLGYDFIWESRFSKLMLLRTIVLKPYQRI
jgi:hypothetical protein